MLTRSALLAALAFLVLSACSRQASAQPLSVRPLWSERVIDGVGVNVHLHYEDTPYGRRWEQLRDVLIGSGIRHIRDGLIDTAWEPYYQRLNALGSAGIGVTLVAQWNQSPELLRSYPSRVRNIEAYEGPNETDVSSGVSDWAQRLRAFQPTLWNAAKSSGRRLQVIGPSLTSEEAYARLGDLGAFEDAGNTHDYPGAHHPENAGWGLHALQVGDYGSIPYNLRVSGRASVGRPIIATETGYTNDLQDKQGVPQTIAGRYLPRLLLEHIRNGVSRTFLYELVDEGTKGPEGEYGLLTEDIQPKPSFVALRSLLEAMKDPGSAPSLSTVDIDIQSDSNDVHWIIFEKRTHELTVALWRAASSYDVRNRKMTPSAWTHVQASVRGYAGQTATARVFNDEGRLVPEAVVATSDRAARVAVSDRVTLLAFPSPQSVRRSSRASRGSAI